MSTMVTVGSVLAQNELALHAVHVPAPELDVRWVATSELLDPAPFLEGGEILLTTGLETRGWRREWDGYVSRLADVRIAALGIGTGLTHIKAPAGLIRACEAHGLNLIEVPRGTPFVAISRRTAQLLQQDEAEAAREALRIQRRLTSAAAKPDATAAVIQMLAHVVGGAACVLSTDGHAILGPLGERGDELLTPDVVTGNSAPTPSRAARSVRHFHQSCDDRGSSLGAGRQAIVVSRAHDPRPRLRRAAQRNHHRGGTSRSHRRARTHQRRHPSPTSQPRNRIAVHRRLPDRPTRSST